MRGRLVIATVAVGILLAATAVPGTTSPVSAVECPAQPLTVGELTALWDHGGYAGFMGLVNHNGRRCYGDADLTVVGYVDSPEGIGGVNSFVIKPLWMTMSGLMLMSGSAADRHGSSWFYPIAMPPRFGDLNERYHHRWVAVTAHFDDPRALTCRAEGPADTNPPSKAQAVRMCRSILVLSKVRTIPAPDTATAAARDGASVPTSVPLLAAAAIIGVGVWTRRRSESKRPGR